jgi:hypothetical protein
VGLRFTRYARAVPTRIPTPEQQEKLLELVAAGKTRQEAAEEIEGTSSTMWRTFINGKSEESQAFAQRYLAVLEEAGTAPSPLAGRIKELEGVQLAHRLLDEFIMRALDSERGKSGSSNRMLHNLSLLKLEDFKPLLEARTRHIHEGAVGIYQMPQIDTSKWSLEEHREFVALRKRMGELVALAQPETAQPGRELPPGPDDIEGEASEIDESEAA